MNWYRPALNSLRDVLSVCQCPPQDVRRLHELLVQFHDIGHELKIRNLRRPMEWGPLKKTGDNYPQKRLLERKAQKRMLERKQESAYSVLRSFVEGVIRNSLLREGSSPEEAGRTARARIQAVEARATKEAKFHMPPRTSSATPSEIVTPSPAIPSDQVPQIPPNLTCKCPRCNSSGNDVIDGIHDLKCDLCKGGGFVTYTVKDMYRRSLPPTG